MDSSIGDIYRPPSQPAGRQVAAWAAGTIGTVVLIVCLSVAGTYIATLTEARADVGRSLGVIAGAVAIGAVFGLALPYVAARAWAMVLFALTALTLLTGGPLLVVVAFVIRQMESPDVANDRGFLSLWSFGVFATALGFALGAWLLARLQSVDARHALASWSRRLGAGYGVFLGLAGIMTALAFLALINARETVDVDGNVSSVVEQALLLTFVAAGLIVPGVILTYHCISSAMGEPSGRFDTPRAMVLLATFAGAMLAGQAIMMQDSPIAAPMPVLHVLAAAMPGLTLAAMAVRGSPLAGRAVGGLTWRQVTLATAISMGLATVIAVYVEGIGSYYAIVLLLVHNGAFESITAYDDFNRVVENAEFLLTDNEQFAAGLITAAILAPVIEEFSKSLAVRFTMSPWTTRGQAFVLGAYAGAGFGFLEALSYGLIGIDSDLGGWWLIMLVRGGSTSLHVLCSGLAGVAWWYWTRGKRPGIAAGLFGAAITIHAGWNAFFTAIDSRIFVLETVSNQTLEIVAYAVVISVSAAMIVAIPIVSRRLRDPMLPPASDTPLGMMAPWLG